MEYASQDRSENIPHMTTLELRADFTGKQVVQILKEQADSASNASSAMGRPTGEQLLNSYLTWAENAMRALGNVIEWEAADDLVHTQHYWALRTATEETPRLVPEVMAELDSRKQVITAAAESLDRECRRWQAQPTTLVVPDTNLFLQEGKPFWEIDWLAHVGRAVDVRLVVPIVVVHELDRLKRTGNNTARSLARQALRWLASTLPSDPHQWSEPLFDETPTTRVEVYVDDGPTRPEDADGVIIKFARRLARLSELSTRLVTYDLGMRLRAATVGVAAVQLPDD